MNTYNEQEDEQDAWTFFARFKDPEKEKEYFARLKADPTYRLPKHNHSSPEMVAMRERHRVEDEAKLMALNAQRNKGLTPVEIAARDRAEWAEVMRNSEPDVEAIRARMARNDAEWDARQAAKDKPADSVEQ